MVPRLVRCVLVLAALLQGARFEESRIAFGDPDLSTIIPSEHGDFLLDAFKAAGNDRILQSNDTLRLSQLQWFTLGEPKLVRSRSRVIASEESLFDVKFDRVTVKISTITPAHRKDLAAVVRDKYGLDISERQLMPLPLSSVSCQMTMRDDADQLFLLTGKAGNLQTFPIGVDFIAPKSSAARQLLERVMKDHPDELNMDCTFYSKGKETRINSFELSSERINQLGIIGKLFGPGDYVHVTHQQLVKLSTDLYSALSILEEYAMPQYEFNEAFISELLQQTASSLFSDADVDGALAGLSTYTLEKTVTAEEIKEALSSLYSVETVKNLRKIKLNQSTRPSGRQSNVIPAKNTAIAALFGISIGPTSRMTEDNVVSPSLSLEDQLAALNSFPESAVRWKIVNSKLVPKSLRVAKLWRGNFKKTIHFNRIFRQVTEAPFARTVRMEIDDKVQLETRASQQQEIVKLKSAVDLELVKQQRQQDQLTKLDALVAQQQQQLQRLQDEIVKLKSNVTELAKLLQHLRYADKNLEEEFHQQNAKQQPSDEQQPVALTSTPREVLTEKEKNLIKEWEGNMFEKYKSAGLGRNSSTVLHFASEEGPIEVVRALLARGDDVNAQRSDGRTPLHLASFYGKTDIVALLIQYGADVNQKDNGDDGATPLHKASYNGKNDVVTLLIQNGADVNGKMNDGASPLHKASWIGNTDTVALLIRNGADVNAKRTNGITPLHEASWNGYTKTAEVLIKAGANVNDQDNSGETPLLKASNFGKIDVVTLLIRNGADVNSKSATGMTPLHLASWNGKTDVVSLLIKNGADIAAKQNQGGTALHLASYQGKTDIVKLLIQNGADIYHKDNNGWTPLHLACSRGYPAIVEVLIKAGSNVNEKNKLGQTPLHLASSESRTRVVSMLLRSKADKNIKDTNGKTPKDIAGKDEIKLLLS